MFKFLATRKKYKEELQVAKERIKELEKANEHLRWLYTNRDRNQNITPIKKALELQKEKRDTEICLNNGVCPTCGNQLEIDKDYWKGEEFCDLCDISYNCLTCGYHTVRH